MSHDINNLYCRFLHIGNMLGLQKEDIERLKKMASDKEAEKLQMISVPDPIDCYKEPSGPYYGTISIKDF